MEFNDNKAIYLQIAGMIYERILSGAWKPSERIPAVRELSVSLEVNPNTVMRTYQLLENMNIISVKRGTGFYLTENAYALVYANQKKEFMEEQLPRLFGQLKLLRISPGELTELYDRYIQSSVPGENA